jgi:hypothetical protein
MYFANNSIITKLNLRCLLTITFLFGFFIISGCATAPDIPAVDPQTASESVSSRDPGIMDQQGWWRVSFHRDHQEDEDPMWHIGTLFAYEVIKPVLDDNQQLVLWRFHQRARADKAGHNFSFYFYSERKDAESVYQLVNDNPLVAQLLDNHYIERLSFADVNDEVQSAIESVSDKSWPVELQKSWPYFMKGASETWLSLVDEFYRKQQLIDTLDVEQQVEVFKDINDKINKIWEQKGHHAFLHHLNALFDYQELYIIERRLKRF